MNFLFPWNFIFNAYFTILNMYASAFDKGKFYNGNLSLFFDRIKVIVIIMIITVDTDKYF